MKMVFWWLLTCCEGEGANHYTARFRFVLPPKVTVEEGKIQVEILKVWYVSLVYDSSDQSNMLTPTGFWSHKPELQTSVFFAVNRSTWRHPFLICWWCCSLSIWQVLSIRFCQNSTSFVQSEPPQRAISCQGQSLPTICTAVRDMPMPQVKQPYPRKSQGAIGRMYHHY